MILPTTIEPSTPAFSAIWRIGADRVLAEGKSTDDELAALREGVPFTPEAAFPTPRRRSAASVPRFVSRRHKDRVGDRGDDRRGSGFANPARRLRTLDDMDLDRRRFVDAQHLVSVGVGLLDTSVLEGDLAIERSRNAKDDRALDLRPDDIGIDDNAAIDAAQDDARPLP